MVRIAGPLVPRDGVQLVAAPLDRNALEIGHVRLELRVAQVAQLEGAIAGTHALAKRGKFHASGPGLGHQLAHVRLGVGRTLRGFLNLPT